MAPKRKRALSSEDKGGSSTRRKGLLLVCTVVVLLSALLVGWYSRDGVTVKGRRSVVPRIVFPGGSYRTIAESRIPLILTNTIADKWKARKSFTTSFLARKFDQVSVYYQPKQRHFITFHDNKPLEPLVLDEKWEDYNLKVNITIPELLQWENVNLSVTKEGPWHYYSQDVNQIKSVFPDILYYIQPINDLILSEDNVQVNLWIGRAGIITHTHYDATYNFFVQLQGKKRFTLFPPNQTMYLYPCLHPHYGHSQVDILNPNISWYPLFRSSESVVAEVGPGDMLVVPPYWFHHVETLEESVSVNVWSDAPEYEIMNNIYAEPIPFEEEWTWPELVIATQIYSVMILSSVGITDSKQFIHSLVSERYIPLVRRGSIAFDTALHEELHKIFSTTHWALKEQVYSPLFQDETLRIASLLKSIPSKATIRVCAANYLEHLIHRTVGLEYVCPFLSLAAGLHFL